MTEFVGKKPYRPNEFLQDNRAVIDSVFPDFFSQTQNDNEDVDPELQYKSLEDRVLDITAHEPAMQLLGRERFAILPQIQRFQLVKDSLELIKALEDAKQQIME